MALSKWLEIILCYPVRFNAHVGPPMMQNLAVDCQQDVVCDVKSSDLPAVLAVLVFTQAVGLLGLADIRLDTF